MLWELLTGTRPFLDEDSGSDWAKTLKRMTARRRLGVGPSAMNQLPSDCPPGLEQVLLTCLAPDPGDRFATAGQVARQLELCLQPRAQRLLQTPESGWRYWSRRFPLVAAMVAGLLPNVIASGLNLWYNIPKIFERLDKTAADVFTDPLVAAVNTVAYTAGIALVLPYIWPVIWAVRRAALGEPRDGDRLPRVRNRCFWMADLTAIVGAALWIISGIVYPVSLSSEAGASMDMVELYAQFIGSQVLNGMIATSIAFFCMSYLSMRVFFRRCSNWSRMRPKPSPDCRG